MKFTTKKYIWSGVNSEGVFNHGETSAVTLKHAELKLARQGILIHHLYKKNLFAFKKPQKKIHIHHIMIFFRQLSTLFNSGIPLMESCDLLLKSEENSQLRIIILTLKLNIASGKRISAGFRQFPKYFDAVTCQLIQAGEESGTFAKMLNRIATSKEKTYLLQNKIKQALFYPTIISIFAIIITLLMLVFIIPRFAEVFQQRNEPLPWLTLLVIKISDFIRQCGWLIVLGLIILFGLFNRYKDTLGFKLYFDQLIIKMPFMNRFFQKIMMSHFARDLSILFSAGIPIVESVKMIAPTSKNIVYQKAILFLYSEINKGEPLHLAMQNHILFPTLLVQMIKIGEESGALEHLLEKTSDLYDAEIDQIIGKLNQSLEPLIMTFLGALIGGLVIAMYLPIFKLGTML